MSFSSAVLLGDLNDFIAPSQQCIKPIPGLKNTEANSTVKIDNGEYYQVQTDGAETKMETAAISLNDCLACSGCITSAESVLVSMQSHGELIKELKENEVCHN